MLELTRAGLAIRAATPMGYCDHFGLRRFAEDDALGDRIADSLKTGGGTLAVSWLNLGEYANVTSRETRVQVERLLDRTMPAVFPLDVDVGPVSKRELAGQLDPHADRELARLFVRARPSIAASGVDLRITASGLFEPLNHDRLIRSKHRLAATTRGALKKLRRQHADDPGFQRLVRATRKPGARAATDTDAVTRSLAATFFPDLRREITLNDAIDFLHAVVPVAFCDAVLLDGATHDLVERARRQYPGVRMAPTFSGRADGIERFLARLANG